MLTNRLVLVTLLTITAILCDQNLTTTTGSTLSLAAGEITNNDISSDIDAHSEEIDLSNQNEDPDSHSNLIVASSFPEEKMEIDLSKLNEDLNRNPNVTIELGSKASAASEETNEVDLSKLDQEQDMDSKKTKVEANDAGGIAPKIKEYEESDSEDTTTTPIPLLSAEVPSNEEIEKYIIVEDPLEPTSTVPTSSTAETSAPKYTLSDILMKSHNISEATDDGVVLPTDNDDEVVENLDSKNATETTAETPLTFYEQSSKFLYRFTSEHREMSILVLTFLIIVLLVLLFLIFRECCKNRKRNSPRRTLRFESITSDLYNTSSCSQTYKPTVLPNQQEVTMQLLSADCTIDA